MLTIIIALVAVVAGLVAIRANATVVVSILIVSAVVTLGMGNANAACATCQPVVSSLSIDDIAAIICGLLFVCITTYLVKTSK